MITGICVDNNAWKYIVHIADMSESSIRLRCKIDLKTNNLHSVEQWAFTILEKASKKENPFSYIYLSSAQSQRVNRYKFYHLIFWKWPIFSRILLHYFFFLCFSLLHDYLVNKQEINIRIIVYHSKIEPTKN